MTEQGRRRGWEEADMRELADLEVRLVTEGYEGQLVDMLAERLPGRTRDGLKGVRKKGEYSRLVEERMGLWDERVGMEGLGVGLGEAEPGPEGDVGERGPWESDCLIRN